MKKGSIFILILLIAAICFSFSGVAEGAPPPPQSPSTARLTFPCQAAIQGYAGKYANDADGGANLNIQATSVGANEIFDFIDLGETQIAIQGSSGNYANELDYNFNIQHSTIGPAETHTFISLGENNFAIQGSSGDYARDAGDGNFYMDARTIEQQETLTLVPISGCLPIGDTDLDAAPFTPPLSVTVPTQGLPTDLGQLIQQIFTWSLAVLGIAVFVMVFYAGFLWLTAAGNTAKVGEAKSRITNAVFGAIILLSAYLILYTINPDFVRSAVELKGLGK